MRYLFCLSLIFGLGSRAHARQYFSTEVEFNLYKFSIDKQNPVLIGGPLKYFYQYADDGALVMRDGQVERGHHVAGRDENELTMTFEPQALADLVNHLVQDAPVGNPAEVLAQLPTIQRFLALTIASGGLGPVKFQFNGGGGADPGFLQMHSSYSFEESPSYHLTITPQKPFRSN